MDQYSLPDWSSSLPTPVLEIMDVKHHPIRAFVGLLLGSSFVCILGIFGVLQVFEEYGYPGIRELKIDNSTTFINQTDNTFEPILMTTPSIHQIGETPLAADDWSTYTNALHHITFTYPRDRRLSETEADQIFALELSDNAGALLTLTIATASGQPVDRYQGRQSDGFLLMSNTSWHTFTSVHKKVMQGVIPINTFITFEKNSINDWTTSELAIARSIASDTQDLFQ